MNKLTKLLALSVAGAILITGCGDKTENGTKTESVESIKYGERDIVVKNGTVFEKDYKTLAEGTYFNKNYIEGENKLTLKNGEIINQVLKDKKTKHILKFSFANKKLSSMSSDAGYNHKFFEDGTIKEVNYDLAESSSNIVVEYNPRYDSKSIKYALIIDKMKSKQYEYSNRKIVVTDTNTNEIIARYGDGDHKYNPTKRNWRRQVDSLDKQLNNYYSKSLKTVR